MSKMTDEERMIWEIDKQMENMKNEMAELMQKKMKKAEKDRLEKEKLDVNA